MPKWTFACTKRRSHCLEFESVTFYLNRYELFATVVLTDGTIHSVSDGFIRFLVPVKPDSSVCSTALFSSLPIHKKRSILASNAYFVLLPSYQFYNSDLIVELWPK